MMLCLGWWAFEIISVMIGYIGVEEQAANFCIFQIHLLFYMMTLGLNQAASSKIGQMIGLGDVIEAREYFRAGAYISITICITCSITFFLFGRCLLGIMTDNEAIIEKAMTVQYYVCIQMLPDYWQGFMQGPIRAIGIQAKAVPYSLGA
jgi:MATE family multidrug resistance protein